MARRLAPRTKRHISRHPRQESNHSLNGRWKVVSCFRASLGSNPFDSKHLEFWVSKKPAGLGVAYPFASARSPPIAYLSILDKANRVVRLPCNSTEGTMAKLAALASLIFLLSCPAAFGQGPCSAQSSKLACVIPQE